MFVTLPKLIAARYTYDDLERDIEQLENRCEKLKALYPNWEDNHENKEIVQLNKRIEILEIIRDSAVMNCRDMQTTLAESAIFHLGFLELTDSDIDEKIEDLEKEAAAKRAYADILAQYKKIRRESPDSGEVTLEQATNQGQAQKKQNGELRPIFLPQPLIETEEGKQELNDRISKALDEADLQGFKEGYIVVPISGRAIEEEA